MLHAFNTKFGKNIENQLLGRRGENADSALIEPTWDHLLRLGALGREELAYKTTEDLNFEQVNSEMSM